MFLQWSKNLACGRGVRETGLAFHATKSRANARREFGQKPPFLACQKVAPPPCKKPPFLHFPRRKACNFDQFVHENAHFWHLFCGHSSRPMGCQSVGKKPANLYSTKCRIFGPRTPPACGTVVGHQFPTPSHGLPYAQSIFSMKSKNRLISMLRKSP
jgi:hypothetical protein